MKRGRNQRRRQGVNPNRALDSNGPDVRIRGTANQIYDKYQALARDAASSGDRVKTENYLQHAEHYYRLIRSMQPDRPVHDTNDQDGDQDMDQQPQPRRSARGSNGRDRSHDKPDHDNQDSDENADDENETAPSRRPGKTRDAASENASGGEPGDDDASADKDAGDKSAERKPRRKKRAPRAAKPAADGDGSQKVKEEASA